jgi:hypothetical protein
MATKELGLTPTTEGAGDFKMSLSEFIDGYSGHEHAYEIYPLYADVAKLAAMSGTVYTPTLIIAYGGPTGREYWFTRENPHDDPKVRRFYFHPELDHRVLLGVAVPLERGGAARFCGCAPEPRPTGEAVPLVRRRAVRRRALSADRVGLPSVPVQLCAAERRDAPVRRSIRVGVRVAARA